MYNAQINFTAKSSQRKHSRAARRILPKRLARTRLVPSVAHALVRGVWVCMSITFSNDPSEQRNCKREKVRQVLEGDTVLQQAALHRAQALQLLFRDGHLRHQLLLGAGPGGRQLRRR
jgi:hypothetical protein